MKFMRQKLLAITAAAIAVTNNKILAVIFIDEKSFIERKTVIIGIYNIRFKQFYDTAKLYSFAMPTSSPIVQRYRSESNSIQWSALK